MPDPCRRSPQVARAGELSGVRPHGVDAGVECGVGAAQRVGRKSAHQVRHAHQPPRFEHRERQERGHRLGAVHQPEPFARRETHRREPGVQQRLGGGNETAGAAHPAAAEERQREMGERCEIAARADRATARHLRQQVMVEERQELVDEQGPHARMPFGQRVRPQDEHAAHGGVREGLADPAACESTRRSCSVSRSASAIRTLARFPKPVLTPYTASPEATERSITARAAATRSRAAAVRTTCSPPAATAANSSNVSDPPVSSINLSSATPSASCARFEPLAY